MTGSSTAVIVCMRGTLWGRQPILACFVWAYFPGFFCDVRIGSCENDCNVLEYDHKWRIQSIKQLSRLSQGMISVLIQMIS